MRPTHHKHLLLHLVRAHHDQARVPHLSGHVTGDAYYRSARKRLRTRMRLEELRLELAELDEQRQELEGMAPDRHMARIDGMIQRIRKKIQEKERESRR